jgi:hypothetical protein
MLKCAKKAVVRGQLGLIATCKQSCGTQCLERGQGVHDLQRLIANAMNQLQELSREFHIPQTTASKF